jgi:hypothetical protein
MPPSAVEGPRQSRHACRRQSIASAAAALASATHVGAAVLVGLAVVGAGVVAGDDAPATVGRHVVNVGACVGDCASAA